MIKVSSPGRDKVKDRYPLHAGQNLCRPLRSLRTLTVPWLHFHERMSNGRWHRNTQITHNSSKLIKMTTVTFTTERRGRKHLFSVSTRSTAIHGYMTMKIRVHRYTTMKKHLVVRCTYYINVPVLGKCIISEGQFDQPSSRRIGCVTKHVQMK